MKAKLSLGAGLLSLFVLAAAGSSPRGILDNKFARADTNHDNQLTLQEFLSTQPGNTRYTDARFSFNLADTDHSGSLSLIEFLASRGGKDGGKPDRRETFDLADLDHDGFLDPDEFALTEPGGKGWPKLSKQFHRLDKDGNSLISRDEWLRGNMYLP